MYLCIFIFLFQVSFRDMKLFMISDTGYLKKFNIKRSFFRKAEMLGCENFRFDRVEEWLSHRTVCLSQVAEFLHFVIGLLSCSFLLPFHGILRSLWECSSKYPLCFEVDSNKVNSRFFSPWNLWTFYLNPVLWYEFFCKLVDLLLWFHCFFKCYSLISGEYSW